MAQLLSGLVLAFLPTSIGLHFHVGGKTAIVTASQILIVALVFYYVVSALLRKVRPSFRNLRLSDLLLISAFLLIVPAFLPTDRGAALVACFNYLSGTVAGYCIGRIWARSPVNRYTAVDLGLAVFALVGSGELLIDYLGKTPLENLHQSADTSWGGSNYIAGALVVVSFVLIARGHVIERFGYLLWILAGLTIVLSLLTASRGAIVEVGVGAIVLIWRFGRTRRQKVLWRVGSIVVPAIAYALIEAAVAIRGAQVSVNVSARYTLYEVSWRQFLSSPIWGTGWTALRAPSKAALGTSATFGHNLFVSFLQIGGLLAVPFLVVLIVIVIRIVVRGGPIAAPVAASMAIAMTEPFFEGSVAATIAIAAAIFGLSISCGGDPGVREWFASRRKSVVER